MITEVHCNETPLCSWLFKAEALLELPEEMLEQVVELGCEKGAALEF